MTVPLATPFLDAARERRLVVQRCASCGAAHLPPRARCPACGGTRFRWARASGRASLVSYVVQHRAPPDHLDRLPYVYALAALEEGPRMVTNVVGTPPDALAPGMPLRAVFGRVDAEGRPWPEFRVDAPADDPS